MPNPQSRRALPSGSTGLKPVQYSNQQERSQKHKGLQNKILRPDLRRVAQV